MARSWLIDSRGLAKKVINASLPAACQIKDCGANTRCPSCDHLMDNSDISYEWPGLPAGVKFDPSDVELLDHLAAKRGVGKSEPHLFIDEFIPTLDDEGGICCTHPENLPGVKRDGSSVHFFYKIINAYASGRRKRRRVGDQERTINSCVRWHKTGKTKAVMQNGIQRGFKKIMVLYETSKRGCKPEKCNWVMHQYHLGSDEDEKEGEYVVSKIFHQQEKETDKNENPTLLKEEANVKAVPVIPMTPKTTTPDPPRLDQTPYSDCLSNDYFLKSLLLQETEHLKEPYQASYGSRLEDVEFSSCLGGNIKAVDATLLEPLFCNEIIESYDAFGELEPQNPCSTQVNCDINAVNDRDANGCSGIGELDNIELDTPPDFNSQELEFPSQDSVFDMLDLLY
ncbi:SUPPRESSOR OF GAMMA RESPONSE 1-like isoform X1 [Salvia hispanica]|uniref:SUPPRESSOR OF GAMMA RESPONSE 1-like isoform X1 n=1 Tax=Salvia hispanica TaxID=49212 RepID=UPI0020098CD2|nr:SUPPRESSOR OF GAMMA RESPONSE 1-like isoform X1 [Salvia hispanica]